VLFDTLGVMAEYIGAAIGEGPLPGIYIPPILQLWNNMAVENPFDRALLPLIEALSSSTVVCGLNYQPWALESFDMAMSTIEACSIIIAHEDDLEEIDEDMTDPIICAVDLIDGLVEGLGPNFAVGEWKCTIWSDFSKRVAERGRTFHSRCSDECICITWRLGKAGTKLD